MVLPEDSTSVVEFLRTCCCQLTVTSALTQGLNHSLVWQVYNSLRLVKQERLYKNYVWFPSRDSIHPNPSPSIWHSMAHLPIKHITKETDQLCTVKCNKRFYQYWYLLMALKETRKIQNVTSNCHCSSNSLQTIFLFICWVTTWVPPSALWWTEKDPEPLVRKAAVKINVLLEKM